MATVVLQYAGSLIGGIIGGPIGAEIGAAIGSFAGARIDASLIGGQTVKRTGPRLTDTSVQSSTEGAPIPAVFGRARVAGQLVWASQFKETIVKTTQTAGGKGTPKTTVANKDYTYSISFAVGLCEGVVHKLGRVWADGNLFDLSQATVRFYQGTEDQTADPAIETIEGAGNSPAYRGLCYVVFEGLPLANFGNRIPQLSFELIRSITADNPSSLENRLGGVTLIPGAGEFVYATESVSDDDGKGATTTENVHGADGQTDIDASLDELVALAPNLGAVALVVGWFGDDLRAGHTLIKPGVEDAAKKTYPLTWSVDGVARAGAHVVSQIGGRPAYGGTPSDATVVQAIADLNARGLRVTFYPFLFMDIAAGNALSDPYGGTEQAAYPWRGRITCDPAPGQPGSPDQTATAATQVNAFFGSAAVSDFHVDGTDVSWTGGADWGLRRMVLHYAHLCAASSGVDAFLIGSELRGLTRVRSATTTYPAVAALKTLAADVKSIFTGAGQSTKVGYAADWSEYNNHQTGDAPGAVQFNLDPLWADANIDFVGIDNYLPLADWRDGAAHLDYNASGPTTTHDSAYLTANIDGGEDYDWYYASDADRAAQTRTSISDGAYAKPWVFRQKDFRNWWGNAHYDRVSGTESGTPTAWTAQSKPIWFAELGCPAVDKGANQPNVFVDPKSSESALPYFSNGERDDLIQRRFLEAHLNFWRDSANNPTGTYGGPMVDADNIYVWTWDARPFPFFPSRGDIWGDAGNYALGHWLNGRLGAVVLSDLVPAVAARADFAAVDASDLSGLVTGYVIDSTMSVRDALDPLALAYHFDGVESEGEIKFVPRGRSASGTFGEDDVVVPDDDATLGVNFTRAQESDLPLASRVAYIDAEVDYRQAVAEARRLVALSDRVAESELPIVLDQGEAIGIGERLLQDAWVMRETAAFALPPSQIALDPADEIVLTVGGRDHRLRLTEIDDAGARSVTAVATDPSIYEALVGPDRGVTATTGIAQTGRPLVAFLDLPLLTGNEIPWAPHVAARADPWPGQVLVYRSPVDSGYALDIAVTKAATIGELTFDFYSGPTGRWDKGNELWVTQYDGAFASVTDIEVLGGANALAIQNADGDWEIVQFRDATLVAPNQWKLTMLLRGQAGSEGAMRAPVAAGARVVVLGQTLPQTSLSLDQRNLDFFYLWGPAGKDISDPAYQGGEMAFAGVGLRPLSPTDMRARWPTVAGDIDLTWIRRTRIGGDIWDNSDVPLSEENEAYEVDIYNGSTVVRTLSASSPAVTYTLAEQTADFGGQQWSVSIAAYQLSASFGRGQGRSATLYY